MGTAGPGTHGVWTRVYPLDMWEPEVSFALSVRHSHVVVLHRGLEGLWVRAAAWPAADAPDAQRLPALCHVWVCGFFSESLKTHQTPKELSAKIACPLRPGTLRRRCPSAAALGAVEIRGAAGRRPEAQQAQGVHASPLSYPLRVALSRRRRRNLKPLSSEETDWSFRLNPKLPGVTRTL